MKSKDPFYEVGRFYAFDYEANRIDRPNFVWWECIDIKDGWAVLYKMSKDFEGEPRPSTSVVEVTWDKMIKKPFTKRLFLSPNPIFDYKDGNVTAQFTVTADRTTCSNPIIAEFDRDDRLIEIKYKKD